MITLEMLQNLSVAERHTKKFERNFGHSVAVTPALMRRHSLHAVWAAFFKGLQNRFPGLNLPEWFLKICLKFDPQLIKGMKNPPEWVQEYVVSIAPPLMAVIANPSPAVKLAAAKGGWYTEDTTPQELRRVVNQTGLRFRGWVKAAITESGG